MRHSHRFVEEYDGIMAFGLDRKSDEETITCYLQKFSDDQLMEVIIGRLRDAELEEILQLLSRLMRTHLTDGEYHKYFLKD